MITEKAYQVLNNVTPIVQKCIYAINIYYSDHIMSFSTPINSVTNTLKNIYPGGTLWDEFISEYYNDNNESF